MQDLQEMRSTHCFLEEVLALSSGQVHNDLLALFVLGVHVAQHIVRVSAILHTQHDQADVQLSVPDQVQQLLVLFKA